MEALQRENKPETWEERQEQSSTEAKKNKRVKEERGKKGKTKEVELKIKDDR